MKYEIIERFFEDLSQYSRFLLKSKAMSRASSDCACVATLLHDDGKFLYMLEWKDGRCIYEYVRPFRATEENFRLFNAGCAEMARRFRIYLETGDADQVTKPPPAFGILSYETPEEKMLPVGDNEESAPAQKYFPAVRDARLVKRYDCEKYDILLLTDVKCAGIIRCDHMLVAFKKGDNSPSYVIAAEVNTLQSLGDGSGSHFLGCYPGSGHINYGCSDEWGDINRFERRARELMSEALGIRIAEPCG